MRKLASRIQHSFRDVARAVSSLLHTFGMRLAVFQHTLRAVGPTKL